MPSNPLAEDQNISTASRPSGHPLEEILYRLRDPRLVTDTLWRATEEKWHMVSWSEFSGLFRKVRRYTMCSAPRLRALHQSAKYIVARKLDGEVVECGCARGGSAALIALSLQSLGERRKMWLFDTFEGLPAPSVNDPDYKIADLFTGTCVGRLDEVREMFRSLGVAEGVSFVKGLFQDTLSTAPIGRIALLHIDGDWYESVKVCLETLYDKVVPGGYIQFDDYGYWKGARRAVDEFLAKRQIREPLKKLDYSGRSLVKPQD